ncbi:Uncharacterized protein dnm_041330 [Desulfonema magnum]|uniref:Uncharacterized protein n=1 Tax=Desulfonema magnum TaxID=45655 RepID=A0A975GNT1_9BACT|nr:Uncharacterized protein dnm_041330 [Desulfonema magnum]
MLERIRKAIPNAAREAGKGTDTVQFFCHEDTKARRLTKFICVSFLSSCLCG